MNSFQIYIHILIIRLRLQIIIEEAILGLRGFVYFPLTQFNPEEEEKKHNWFLVKVVTV